MEFENIGLLPFLRLTIAVISQTETESGAAGRDREGFAEPQPFVATIAATATEEIVATRVERADVDPATAFIRTSSARARSAHPRVSSQRQHELCCPNNTALRAVPGRTNDYLGLQSLTRVSIKHPRRPPASLKAIRIGASLKRRPGVGVFPDGRSQLTADRPFHFFREEDSVRYPYQR